MIIPTTCSLTDKGKQPWKAGGHDNSKTVVHANGIQIHPPNEIAKHRLTWMWLKITGPGLGPGFSPGSHLPSCPFVGSMFLRHIQKRLSRLPRNPKAADSFPSLAAFGRPTALCPPTALVKSPDSSTDSAGAGGAGEAERSRGMSSAPFVGEGGMSSLGSLYGSWVPRQQRKPKLGAMSSRMMPCSCKKWRFVHRKAHQPRTETPGNVLEQMPGVLPTYNLPDTSRGTKDSGRKGIKAASLAFPNQSSKSESIGIITILQGQPSTAKGTMVSQISARKLERGILGQGLRKLAGTGRCSVLASPSRHSVRRSHAIRACPVLHSGNNC